MELTEKMVIQNLARGIIILFGRGEKYITELNTYLEVDGYKIVKVDK